MREKKYTAWGAYGQSKLANLLFTRELQRRFVAAKVDAIAVRVTPDGRRRTWLHPAP
jgi:NAD(P)-dependent dehydrogenase (short-subunit alcohol dehydrogenase family)